ncbi:MAG TPA: energy transducer TonB [Allosphingosinicella sp.]|nr:energy transducer TonB [Allosphingosinicella sp.]
MFANPDDFRRNDRIKAAVGVALLEGALAYALIVGLGMRPPPEAVKAPLQLIGILPERPPPPRKSTPPPKRTPRKEGAASPPNLKAKPTEIVRPPPPPIRIKVPPPVAAAPIAGPGAAPNAGAAPVRGPGTGSGGLGNGTGSGNGGNGAGGGLKGTRAHWLKGELKNSDYPHRAGEAKIGGSVSVRFTVETNGHVTNCSVTRSSGDSDLDAVTCRLIEKRFRYKPATDAAGRPIRSIANDTESWRVLRPDEAEPDDDPDDGD